MPNTNSTDPECLLDCIKELNLAGKGDDSLNSPHNSVFNNVTSYFYHENFHSDLLAYYFRCHKEAKDRLIDWLNEKRTARLPAINKIEYIGGRVIREDQRLDVTLFSKDEKRAIIIENKSNGAADRERQIPRYIEELERRPCAVERVVYLNRSSLDEPCRDNWSPLDHALVDNRLKITDLIEFNEKVIDKIITQTQDARLIGLSLEIKNLFSHIMNEDVKMDAIDKFLNILKQDENLNLLRSAIQNYENIPRYLAWKYNSYIRKEGFSPSIDTKKYPNVVSIGGISPQCFCGDEENISRSISVDIDFRLNPNMAKYSLVPQRKTTERDIERLQKAFGGMPFSQKEAGTNGRYFFIKEDIFNDSAQESAINSLLVFLKNIQAK